MPPKTRALGHRPTAFLRPRCLTPFDEIMPESPVTAAADPYQADSLHGDVPATNG